MSKTSQLRNEIAQIASELFSVTIKPAHVGATPIVVKHGSEKKSFYYATVYDESLNALVEGKPSSYLGAFEDLHKRLVEEQRRRIRESYCP